MQRNDGVGAGTKWATRQEQVLVPAQRRAPLAARVLGMLVISAAAALGARGESPRESAIKLVARIQRADYEGDRATLKKLCEELSPFTENREIAPRVRYWRGFALWRRAINGFNESADPKDLEHDLTQAIAEFRESTDHDPTFVDSKIGSISCLGSLIYLALGNSTRVQELIAQSSPLVKEVKAADPENSRFLWVLGPILWNLPPERGGGQEKVIEAYEKGLEVARKQKATATDPLEPSWGEPELLMSLAWSASSRTTPDLNAAEQNARSALKLVPYWHYVRDILLPQIQQAKAKG